jgi:hypothetical protein
LADFEVTRYAEYTSTIQQSYSLIREKTTVPASIELWFFTGMGRSSGEKTHDNGNDDVTQYHAVTSQL